MRLVKQTIEQISPLNEETMKEARERVDALIKPPNSLGKLESLAVQLAGITKQVKPDITKKAIVTMAADHGVYTEGISGNPQAVTVAQTLNFAKGLPGVCALSRLTNAQVIPVDMGINADLPKDCGVVPRKIKYGTNNIAKGPAMTREEAIRSIETGIEIANEAIQDGVQLLGTGEMGIGNTTPTTAILAVLGECDPEKITGPGAGTGEGGLQHKIAVIRRAIEVNNPNKQDPIDVLQKVGGLEIGGMAGVMLSAAANRIPVVVDGYISTVAALIAVAIEPKVKGYLIASHATGEPGGKLASELLGIKPTIHLDMCLGEGSGAALMFPIIDGASHMITHMPTFAEIGMDI